MAFAISLAKLPNYYSFGFLSVVKNVILSKPGHKVFQPMQKGRVQASG